MQRDNTARHIVVPTFAETGIFHHAQQGFLIGVLADRLCEITIAVGILRDKTTHRRQDLERVLVLHLAQ